ncbi:MULTISPECIES: OsmC family protein [unclassified Gemella]|uniref:OsmC family protein n=1 Tax=unclassified Gemella TaxID=2624949 RepID=UPI00107455D1|nr:MULTISPECIES: hypothetical protein [unclassified Gemella]MBF0709930.1 hypothetical protein [Gemella sp. GL1.1]MBF0746766.1 hypothetical protein [Gemella sp. 19428wG2_WT2a]NYS27274.1 hypothetical protein [Gemella sp. GL1]TFU59491.1 hypothetical protein E4T67_03755 [Gemella sp. WT2a]
MFKAKSSLSEGFEVSAYSTNDNNYKLFFGKEKDGPMDLFTVAFSACILMCAKGYFVRRYNDRSVEIDIELDVDYEKRLCNSKLIVNYPNLSEGDEKGILENIKLRCKVSHFLSDDIEKNYKIVKKEEV